MSWSRDASLSLVFSGGTLTSVFRSVLALFCLIRYFQYFVCSLRSDVGLNFMFICV